MNASNFRYAFLVKAHPYTAAATRHSGRCRVECILVKGWAGRFIAQKRKGRTWASLIVRVEFLQGFQLILYRLAAFPQGMRISKLRVAGFGYIHEIVAAQLQIVGGAEILANCVRLEPLSRLHQRLGAGFPWK